MRLKLPFLASGNADAKARRVYSRIGERIFWILFQKATKVYKRISRKNFSLESVVFHQRLKLSPDAVLNQAQYF